jgi:hypothetical protein
MDGTIKVTRIILACLLVTACGATSTEPTSANASSTALTVETPVSGIVACPTEIGVEGQWLNLVFCDTVDGAKVDERQGDGSWQELFTHGPTRDWRVQVHWDHEYRIVFRYRDGQFKVYARTGKEPSCGGCKDEPLPPQPKPAACSTDALDVAWLPVGEASRRDEQVATVTLRSGYTGTLTAFLSSYDGDGVKIHGPLPFAVPGSLETHLSHRKTSGWSAVVACADGSVLSSSTGAW